jgi:GTPase SAR1 family protein
MRPTCSSDSGKKTSKNSIGPFPPIKISDTFHPMSGNKGDSSPIFEQKKKRKSLENARNFIMNIFGAFQSGSTSEIAQDMVYDGFARVIDPLEKLEKIHNETLMRENITSVKGARGKELLERFDSQTLEIKKDSHSIHWNRRELNIAVYNTARNRILKYGSEGIVTVDGIAQMIDDYDKFYIEYLQDNVEEYREFYWNYLFEKNDVIVDQLATIPGKFEYLLRCYRWYQLDLWKKSGMIAFSKDFSIALKNCGKGYLCNSILPALENCPISFRDFQKSISATLPQSFLLLGAGDSGKTVFFNQFRTRWGKNGDSWVQKEHGPIENAIYANIITSIGTFHRVIEEGRGTCKDSSNNDKILAYGRLIDTENLIIMGRNLWTLEFFKEICQVLSDPGYLKMLEDYGWKYHIPDGFPYFIQNINRLQPPNFNVTVEDALHMRRKTTGVVEAQIGEGITIVDTGGQRNERKKWGQFQKDRKCVFMVSLSDFDQVCYEDDVTNRMLESLELFDDTINHRYRGHDVILIFTKLDIFREKMRHKDLSIAFPDYFGGRNDEYALEFIISKFLERDQSGEFRIQYYYCNLMDGPEVEKIIRSILSIEPYIQVVKKRYVCISRLHDMFFRFQ